MVGGRGRDEAAGAAFWRFSLAFYARPGVAEALIALQDRAGRDVNLMLFALWLGATRGYAIDATEWAAAEAAVAPLTAVAAELRDRRQQLKGTADGALQALRRRILVLELAAERRVQHRLAVTLADRRSDGLPGDRCAAADANLARYLGAAAGTPEAGVLRAALAALMRQG
jgi:uncharacterized protein (TIGR02444 family)